MRGYEMIKRIAPFAGALALACAAFIGCSDSSVSPTEAPTATTDPYVSLSIDNGSLNTFSEVPSSVDEVMNDPLFLPPPPPDSLHPCDSLRRGGGPPPPDSLHRGGGPGPDSLRGGGHGRGPGNPPPPPPPHDSLRHGGGPPPPPDSLHRGGGPGPDTTRHHDLRDTSGHLRPVPLGGVIRQLGLSAEQDSLIRLCFAAQRECKTGAEATYMAARRPLCDSLQATLRAIRAAVEAGTITRAEANTQIRAANDAYRASVGAIEAAYRSALDACQHDFNDCVRSHLTPEQAQKWDALTRH
jgi:hypothetical protein